MTTTPATAIGSGTSGIAHWLHLIRAEYREMPCLSLTKPQMRRLWNLDEFVCDALVDALVNAHVLRRTVSGTYVAAGADHC